MGKRANHLYEKIYDPDNLRLAFVKAARGKQERAEVSRFRADLHENLANLREQLLKKQVKIGNYRYFTVYEPKQRLICAAPFAERVLHHAIMNVLEPVLERYAIHDSYACRKGKGLHAALERAHGFSRKHPWFLKLDIKKYFDSIDHVILMQLLQKRVMDKALLNLCSQLLATYSVRPGKGMPIGNLFSQHSANFYLGALDHEIKDQWGIHGYLRYMDDFVLFGRSRQEMKQLLQRVKAFLHRRLSLELHGRQILNRCRMGIPFLGYRVFPERVKLANKSKNRYVRKFRKYEERYLSGEWDITTLHRHMMSLIGFTLPADAAGLRKSVIVRHGAISEEG